MFLSFYFVTVICYWSLDVIHIEILCYTCLHVFFQAYFINKMEADSNFIESGKHSSLQAGLFVLSLLTSCLSNIPKL